MIKIVEMLRIEKVLVKEFGYVLPFIKLKYTSNDESCKLFCIGRDNTYQFN